MRSRLKHLAVSALAISLGTQAFAGDIVWARDGDIDSLDPHRATSTLSRQVWYQIYDSLLEFDDDGSVEALAAHRPMNPYGWSKHLFDRRVARMAAEDNPRPPQWIGLKFFNVYGPNEYHKGRMQSVVAQVYPVAKQGGAARLFKSHHPDYEDGGQLRDFIWVGDCVDMVAWLLDHPKVNGLFNCGSGEARSFVSLADAVYAALDKAASIEYIDTPKEIREKYQYFTEAKMDRLRAVGYDKPMTSLEEGVRKYVHGFLDSGDPYR